MKKLIPYSDKNKQGLEKEKVVWTKSLHLEI